VSSSRVIGIDGSRLTVSERTGTETYSYQLLQAIDVVNTGEPIRVYLNADHPSSPLPSSYEYVGMPFPRFWTHGRLSWEMVRRPPGVLFVPSHVVPLWHPRTVVTIHDLGYLHEPDSHPTAQRRMLEWTTRWSCRAATKIIAISNSTKHDLVTRYGVSNDKIRVIHHGIEPSFRKATPPEIARVRRHYELPDNYVLFVGTVQPRKNIARIAAAMTRLEASGLPHKLVVAGKVGWFGEEVEQAIAALDRPDLVLRLGYVAPGDLAALYSGADSFCFPSMHEGFGLPILEAMACEVPVIVSDRGSLPEIARDAAVVVDPSSVDQIAEALVRVLTSSAERARLVEAGTRRVRNFSWTASASETLRLLVEVRDQR
jgi:glycosyltransferase involved in cell wall biosynthesis